MNMTSARQFRVWLTFEGMKRGPFTQPLTGLNYVISVAYISVGACSRAFIHTGSSNK